MNHRESDFGAIFSPCRMWRYVLWRRWAAGPAALFIGLNPSTADETVDDPTIRRCIGFARSWGYGALWMANVFAYRTAYPTLMKACAGPVGPQNNEWLLSLSRAAGVVVAAWGTHGAHRNRQAEVIDMLTGVGVTLHALRVTQGGFPGHPLYLPADLRPQPWRTPAERTVALVEGSLADEGLFEGGRARSVTVADALTAMRRLAPRG